MTEPLTEKLSSNIPDPVMVLDVPVINRVPPDAWLNDPDEMVDKLPDNVILVAEKLTCDAATVRLLKLCEPDPLTNEPVPNNTMVPVFPLNVPALSQLP